jgi:hypothetical protein
MSCASVASRLRGHEWQSPLVAPLVFEALPLLEESVKNKIAHQVDRTEDVGGKRIRAQPFGQVTRILVSDNPIQ